MCSVVKILCVLEELATPAWSACYRHFTFQPCSENLLFLSNSVKLLGIFNGIKKLRASERNSYFWNSYLMPWTWNNEHFLRVLKTLQIWWKFQGEEHFNWIFHVFLIIFEAVQGQSEKQREFQTRILQNFLIWYI